MAMTMFNGTQTTFNDNPTPAANKIVTVKQWAEALEPRATPLLSKIGFGDALDQRPWYWGQSQRMGFETTIAEVASAGEADIDVASGQGELFTKGTVVEIIDFLAGSTTVLDQSTREVCIVTAVSNDTVSMTRGQGGTADVEHASGAKIFVIGSAEKEAETTRTLTSVSRGFQFYNYFQRANAGVAADLAAQNMPTWEHPNGNPLMADLSEVTKAEKVKLEMGVWRGGRQAGSTTSPALMGGMDTFITTNVTNLAQAKLTFNLLESELRDLVKTVDGGADGLTFLMSYNTASLFDRTINVIRQATATDTTMSLMLDKVKFRFGTFDIMTSHWCRDGIIYGVRLNQMKVHPFKGLDWHLSKKEGKMHGVDHDQIWISGDFTFVLQKEASMFKLHSFLEDETQYEGYQVFA